MNTILILFGGKSSEYEVSLSSATGAIRNVDASRWNILLAGITRDGRFYLYEDDVARIAEDSWESGKKAPLSLDLAAGALSVRRENGPEVLHVDAVLPMIHGKFCEDGTLQGMFAVAGIPVIGCDCQSSAVCMDKAVAKRLLAASPKTEAIRQAKMIVVRAEDVKREDDLAALRKECESAFPYPMFVKPSRAGSSVGVTKVKSPEAFAEAVRRALAEDSKVLIEEGVRGTEIEVAVLEEKGRYTVAHPAEIDPGSAEFYDYETKYVSDASMFWLPARLSEAEQDRVRGYAEAIFRELDCRGLARVDFFHTEAGEFVFNEINTLPGFTPISMYPKMMVNEGIPYGEILDRLMEGAL